MANNKIICNYLHKNAAKASGVFYITSYNFYRTNRPSASYKKAHNLFVPLQKNCFCPLQDRRTPQAWKQVFLSLAVSLVKLLKMPHVAIWFFEKSIWYIFPPIARGCFFSVLFFLECLLALKCRFKKKKIPTSEHDDSIQEKTLCIFFIITLVLCGLSTQFKNCYVFWSRYFQHKLKWRLYLVAMS